MKKIYIQPAVEVYEMKVNNVLMMSYNVNGNYREGMTDLSRRKDWDDEDEE